MAEEEVFLASSGNIPGLPGNHGPGWYLIDYVERAIRPKPIEQGEPLAQPEAPLESHPDANTGQPENQAPIESVAPAIETAIPEVEATPDQAQQPMEVVAEPASSVPTEEQQAQPEP
jgi:hypothetical protein